jgi:hypothetical protein
LFVLIFVYSFWFSFVWLKTLNLALMGGNPSCHNFFFLPFLVLFFRKSVSAFKFGGVLRAIPSPTNFLISRV